MDIKDLFSSRSSDGSSSDFEKVISKSEMQEMDAEVKKMSDTFRMLLKYREQFQPSGIEFSNLRQYTSGDDASRIDWKASARSDDLYVKEFDEEMDLDVFILVDVSDTMTFGTGEKLKSEYAGLLASTLAWSSVDIGLEVGIGLYAGDKVFITPKGDFTQYQIILEEVTDFNNWGGGLNLEEALDDVIGQVNNNTALFVISDFIEVDGEWEDKLTLASSKFKHCMVMMVRDLRDYQMPEAGNFRFRSPKDGSTMTTNTNSVKEAFEEEAKKQEEEIKNKVQDAGAGFVKIDTRDNFTAELASYFQDENNSW